MSGRAERKVPTGAEHSRQLSPEPVTAPEPQAAWRNEAISGETTQQSYS